MTCCGGGVNCEFTGPQKPTREEAIAAWNSIRISTGSFGIFDTPEYDKIEEMAKQKLDDAPLTEEWLRKAGLYEGDVRLLWRGSDGQRLVIKINGVEVYHYSLCKTIGDARTLCRLLGVTIKE